MFLINSKNEVNFDQVTYLSMKKKETSRSKKRHFARSKKHQLIAAEQNLERYLNFAIFLGQTGDMIKFDLAKPNFLFDSL